MSTKIFNAYVINKPMSAKELLDVAQEFRKDIRSIYEDMVSALTSFFVVNAIDMQVYKDEESFRQYLKCFDVEETETTIFPSSLIEKLSQDKKSKLYAGCQSPTTEVAGFISATPSHLL